MEGKNFKPLRICTDASFFDDGENSEFLMKISFIYRITITLFFAIFFVSYLVYERRPGSIAESEFSHSKIESEESHAVLPTPRPSGAVKHRTEKIESLILALKNSNLKDTTAEERIQISRELNQAYFDSGLENFQRKISEALSHALRQDKSLDVVRAIAFSHSRLYFDENTLPNLKYAHAMKAISFDDYHGELSHIYPEAPDDIRANIIREISSSNNRYAVDIISDRIVSENNIQISSEEISDLHLLLKTNEPIFSGSTDSFGYFDATLYSNWLIAISRLENKKNGINFEQFLGKKLLNPTTDPRASVAFLISSYAKNMDSVQRALLGWDAVEVRAREFIRQNPDSSGLQQIGQEIVNGGTR